MSGTSGANFVNIWIKTLSSMETLPVGRSGKYRRDRGRVISRNLKFGGSRKMLWGV